MTAAVWPETLPQAPLLSGYAEGMGKQALRTDMDAGPAKIRRRSTAAQRPLQWPITVTRAQLAILRAFWEDDCQGGTLAFTMPDAIDAETTNLCRFTEEPSWNALPANDGAGSKMFTLTLQLEILP
jgi:hypothetical protein